MSDDLNLDTALRTGLRAIPVPTVSADFDAAVLAGLRLTQPWWRTLWASAAPMLTGSACSIGATLVLVGLVLHAPDEPATGRPALMQARTSPVAGAASHRYVDLDRLLSDPGLRAASLFTMDELGRAKSNSTGVMAVPADRRPLPRRRADIRLGSERVA